MIGNGRQPYTTFACAQPHHISQLSGVDTVSYSRTWGKKSQDGTILSSRCLASANQQVSAQRYTVSAIYNTPTRVIDSNFIIML